MEIAGIISASSLLVVFLPVIVLVVLGIIVLIRLNEYLRVKKRLTEKQINEIDSRTS